MKTKVFAVLIAVVMVMGMLPLSVSAASTINVTNVTELKNAIETVTPGGTIKIAAGTYIIDSTLSYEAADVTIEGVPDADGNYPELRFTYLNGLRGGLDFNAPNNTFKYLDFVVDASCTNPNKWSTNVIGHYYENVKDRTGCVVDSCNFKNEASFKMIAVYNNTADLTVKNCTIDGFSIGVYNETSASPEKMVFDSNTVTNTPTALNLAWNGVSADDVVTTVTITNNYVGSARVSIHDYNYDLKAVEKIITDNNNEEALVIVINPSENTVIEDNSPVVVTYANVSKNVNGETVVTTAEDLAEKHAEVGRLFYLNYFNEEDRVAKVKNEEGEFDLTAVVSYVNADVASETVTVGETATRPADPTRYRYIFAGWYTDAACTAEYDFTKPVTDAITLYAKWTDDVELNNRLMINALTTSLFRSFSVRATANEGGTLTNEGLVFTMFNNPLKYKATPNEGYEVVSFIVDGVDLGPIDEYRFDYISANHTVEVVFAPITDADA